MAPSTALAFLILGSALCLHLRPPASRSARAYVILGSSIVALWGVVRLLEMASDGPGIEARIISKLGEPREVAGVPTGIMTPISGINFLAAGLALVLAARGWSCRCWRLGQALPLLVIAINTWALWAYLELPAERIDNPDVTIKSASSIFQWFKIPVAIPTALAFLAWPWPRWSPRDRATSCWAT